MSDIDIPLIKAFESCLKKVEGGYTTYYCPANVLTIGWGTTRHDVPTLRPGDVWTREQCDKVFANSLGNYGAIVEKAVAGRRTPLAPHQFGALRSLVYNCGGAALAGSVGRAVREGRDGDVPALMARWNKGGGRVLAGLVRRRKAEGLLYRGDIAAAYRVAEATVPGSMPQSREVPRPTAAELVRATPAASATVATGATAAVSGGAAHSGPEHIVSTAVIVGAGLVLALVVGVLVVRRWKVLAADWA